jgi:hypothetical protein
MFVEKESTLTADTDVCCPLFHPESWDNIQHIWDHKLFLKDAVPEFFHIPLPGSYEKAITRMWNKAKDAHAEPDRKDFLLLAHDPSSFKGELYMFVTKEIPGEQTESLTGTFYSKVFEGPYSDVPRCLRSMNIFLADNKMVSKKDYIYFPYCPKCAKKYGHNYIVVVSRVEPM